MFDMIYTNAKKNFWILTAVLLFILHTSELAQAEWRQVGLAGFTSGEARGGTIALDRDDIPYVAYSDAVNEYKLSVMKFDSKNWVQVGNPGFTEGGNFISFAFDSNDIPYAAAEIGASVMKFDGSNWVQIGALGSESVKECAQGINLTLDSANVSYVAYNNLLTCRMMGVPVPDVVKFDGTNWVQIPAPTGTTTKPQGSLPKYANYPAIAFDSNDVLYVVYSEAGEEGSKASVMKFNGSSWVQVGKARFSSANVEMPKLIFDHDNVPYVAYVSDWNYGKVGMKKFNGTDWVQVGAEGFASVYGVVNIAVDSIGTPYVAFVDYDLKANVMKFEGINWVQVGKAGFTPGYNINEISLAIDSNNIPYASYSDSTKENRVSVMKFDPSYHPSIAIMPWLQLLLAK